MSFSERKWVHDVFFSFRGEDTRHNFVSHINSALRNAGLDTFIDNNLPRGEEISPELVNAIQGSACALVIFSPNYTNSEWCLNELVEIMRCRKTLGQIVLPIFYHVDPSHIRNARYGEFFEGIEVFERVNDNLKDWKVALKESANLSGWHIKRESNESQMIKEVVNTILKRLDRTLLHVAEYPVGIESRVQEVIRQSLNMKSLDVQMVGIWGMGGIGKTTIAKAIYNTIANSFEGSSFIANIREAWKQDNGQVYLQEQLISAITGELTMKIPNVEWGKSLMDKRLHHKKAFVILDDVDKLAQLRALGNRDWFGPGSVIIITTRDKHLLMVHQVDHVFPMREMEENESLELFSWHAFKQASPAEDFIILSKKVVSYCGGLPLALEVLGSYLFKRKMLDWESALSKLEMIPDDQIQEKLKISFDGLSDDKIKDIFLDICCFFIGVDREYVAQILSGCGLYAESGITLLIERSLLQVDRYNKLDMHDLLRDMGREIIRKNFPNEPEKRSRLWLHEDVFNVLTDQIGTKAIEGLALKLPRSNRECLTAEAFKKMKRLRLLQLDHVQLSGDYEHLSRHLRWLCWHGFSLRYMPDNFHKKNLVAIDLKYSNLKFVWMETQLLERLKILNVSHSHNLIHTPDFTKLPNLEQLIVEDCPSLIMVDWSIGELQNLLLVNLKDCKSLKELPRSIYQVKSLKYLIINGCSLIDKLEEDIEQMESLTHLDAANTAIVQVPFSLARSKRIGYISLCGYEGRAHNVLPSIIWSWLSPSNIFGSLTRTLVNIHSKVSLDLLRGLQQTVTTTQNPRCLELKCDSNLQQTQDIASLNASAARNSGQVETTVNASQISNMETSVGVSLRSLMIQMGECNEVANTLVESIKQVWATGASDQCFLPGDKYPDWFVCKGEGSSLTLKVPEVIGHILKGMILCVAFSSSSDDPTSQFPASISIRNHTKATFQHHQQDSTISFEDEKWQKIASDLEPNDKVEVMLNIGHKCAIREITTYLVYGESDHLSESSKQPVDRPGIIDTKGGKKKKYFLFSCFGC